MAPNVYAVLEPFYVGLVVSGRQLSRLHHCKVTATRNDWAGITAHFMDQWWLSRPSGGYSRISEPC